MLTREEAIAILGEGDYNAIYRELSKRCHPDSASPDLELWAKINEAKRILSTKTKCPECNGAGRVLAGKLRYFCVRCRGLGIL